MNLLAILQTTGGQPTGGGMSLILMMLAIFVVMYFLMIRPQQKKQKELAKFRNQLKKGDKIVTIGGIYGIVDEIEERTILMDVDKNVKIRVDKSSVVKDISDVQR